MSHDLCAIVACNIGTALAASLFTIGLVTMGEYGAAIIAALIGSANLGWASFVILERR